MSDDSHLQKIQNRLVAAAWRGDVNAVDQHLREGGDPDLKSSETGDRPLVAAVRGQHARTVKRLMRAGACPNLRSEVDGRNARELADVFGYREVGALLQAG